VQQAADRVFMSQDMGMRKPEARIYQSVLEHEGYTADQAVFFDDNLANIEAARALGIESVLVEDDKTVPNWFASRI
jgi:glucose-1-phosphatase